MELLYNPDRMPEAEIKATFVAREALVDELVELIKSQPDGAGVQHAVIIAPRGMGKTTVLLMVKFAIKDLGLAEQWQAVKFPEESYGIYDLSDFWLETLQLIAADTADAELRKLAEELKTKYPNNDDLQEAAYAALKDWRRRHGKRLLLLVENFDQILEQINDERDNARLRDVLMNEGTVMLLGGATTFFKEARAYDQPLYNFFKIYNLADLKFVQMEDLLRRRAELDRIADFENRLKANASRLRTLEYFTGGNPRLVLMLYHVVSHSDMTEVRRALEKLLDEVTPYYKAKVEALPPQLRKILDHIARISGETREGLTPKEISEAVRLSQNQVSSQLKRLSELGYVKVANLRGRSSWYTLSEPLYAIWHQMRFGRGVREKMGWLVSFLKVWYADKEFGRESKRLEARFRQYIDSDRLKDAYSVLEHHYYLAQAMESNPEQVDVMSRVISAYLHLGDTETVKQEILRDIKLEDLSTDTLTRLCETGCISDEQAQLAKVSKSEASHKQDNFSAVENRTKGWALSADSFNRLLEGLHPDRDQAGYEYEHLRRVLITLFDWRGCAFAEDLADEVFNRVARRIEEGKIIRNLPDYCYSTARRLTLEVLPKQSKQEGDSPEFEHLLTLEEDVEERRQREQIYECFEHCLKKLSPENQELVIQYYQAEKRAKIDNRIALANKWGISLNALKIRVYRLRATLEECISKRLTENQQVKAGQHLPDFWDLLAKRLIFQKNSISHSQYADISKTERSILLPEEIEEQRMNEQIKDLLVVVRSGNIKLAQQLITEAKLEEPLLPLLRALDYLQTGDEALIEKLSPEVRGIVEEVVAKLKTVAPPT